MQEERRSRARLRSLPVYFSSSSDGPLSVSWLNYTAFLCCLATSLQPLVLSLGTSLSSAHTSRWHSTRLVEVEGTQSCLSKLERGHDSNHYYRRSLLVSREVTVGQRCYWKNSDSPSPRSDGFSHFDPTSPTSQDSYRRMENKSANKIMDVHEAAPRKKRHFRRERYSLEEVHSRGICNCARVPNRIYMSDSGCLCETRRSERNVDTRQR